MGDRSGAVRSQPVAVGALVLVGFVSVLVSSVTSMALAPLAAAMGVSMAAVVQVTTAFLITAGLALPVAGWAVDRAGGRLVLLIGIAVFAAGALGGGLAGSFDQLIAARAVQGLGGGSLEPACLALISRITDRRRIGAVMGLMASAINVAPVVGPVVGAVLLSWAGWRGIFLFSAPPMMLAAGLLLLSLPRRVGEEPVPGAPRDGSDPDGPSRPDLAGLVLLGLGFTGVVFALARLGAAAPWTVAGAALAGAALLVIYVRRALGMPDPAVDPRLFADPRFAGAAAIMALGGALLFSMLTVVPLIAREAWGLSGLAQAVPLGAFGTGVLISMSASGALSDRIGSRRIVTVGAVCAALALAAVAVCLLIGTQMTVSLVLLVLAGASYGAVSAPTFASIYRILPEKTAGRGTTAALMGMQMGSALGVTGLGLLVDAPVAARFSWALGALALLMALASGIARAALTGEESSAR